MKNNKLLININSPKTIHKVLINRSFEMLKIESVAKLGSNVFVIINGKRYGIGDRIDRYLIEDIYDDRVIFLLGDTRVMKGVGK